MGVRKIACRIPPYGYSFANAKARVKAVGKHK